MNVIKFFILFLFSSTLFFSCRNKCCVFRVLTYKARVIDSTGNIANCNFNGDTNDDQANISLYLYKRAGYRIDSTWKLYDFTQEECDKLNIELKKANGYEPESCY